MYPRLAHIGRFVDAITMRDVPTNGCLAHTHVDHVRVGWRDSQRAHRGTFKIAIGHICPVKATIIRLPDASARRTKIEHLWMHRVSRHGHNTPTSIGANRTPFQRVQQGGINGCAFLRFLLISHTVSFSFLDTQSAVRLYVREAISHVGYPWQLSKQPLRDMWIL